jgi:tetratricopeptide (TPR) repeat protein
MPFVKKNDLQGSQPPTDSRSIFTGRRGELLFFVQNILKPINPTYNIISISGQGGVGKSTLLTRFIDEAHSPTFKDHCLTATVDERQITSVNIMEMFADQLGLKGKFDRALRQYKETLRKMQNEQNAMQNGILHSIPDFAGAAAESVPIAGPLLREGVKASTKQLLAKYHTDQRLRDAELLVDPLAILTKTFVEELNHLAETQVMLSVRRAKRLRVVLFFDTFEQLAVNAVPWLLNYFLAAEVNNTVVLVIAGRDPIEQSTPEGPKRWLPYYDSRTIYSMVLNSFTEDETRTYLATQGMTNDARITTIWQLSQGLPLYLGLLTSNLAGKIDPTKDVVDNFLRWIPKHEDSKRRLALDAALFSRLFNQDDLEAFTYVSEQERPTLYHWLIGQSFVRVQNGRYRYHDIAQELFRQYLYRHSRRGYHATRRTLAQHYQQLLEELQREEGEEVYRSSEWFALTLALLYQLLCLPDEVSHIKAIEQILSVLIHRDVEQVFQERFQEIRRALHELFETSINDSSPRTQQLIKHLHQWFGISTRGRERLETANFLLQTVAREPSFPPELLVRLYLMRGEAYEGLKGYYQQAIDDFHRAYALLDPTAHRERGWICLFLGEHQQAIRELNQALELNHHDDKAYENRGWAYFSLREYQRAIDDFEHILELDPDNTQGHNGRGQIHMRFKEYQQALVHFERIVELLPTMYLGYGLRGQAFRELKEYQRAMDDFKRALELNPNCFALYERGYVYLWLKDMKHALEDFTSWWELNPNAIDYGWMVEWVSMCQRGPSPNTPERLEVLIAAATSPTRYYPRVCRGVALLLCEYYERAIAELEQAIPLTSKKEPWDAYFWKGMACAFLERREEAMESIEKALVEGMPPVLLAPLHWFAKERQDFYEKYVVSLFAKIGL